MVRCVGVEYRDFPDRRMDAATSRTRGTADTPIIADVQAIDAAFVRSGDERVHAALHEGRHVRGRQFPAACRDARAEGREADGAGRRTAHQRRNPFWNIDVDGKAA